MINLSSLLVGVLPLLHALEKSFSQSVYADPLSVSSLISLSSASKYAFACGEDSS